jgi:hypothetical protein
MRECAVGFTDTVSLTVIEMAEELEADADEQEGGPVEKLK